MASVRLRAGATAARRALQRAPCAEGIAPENLNRI
jgi:hypothetical protein